MYDGGHGAHCVSFVCRRDVVAADLHADYDFIGLAGNHRAESCHCLCQGQGGAAVQDAEGLARALVDGHGGFDAVFGGIGVLDAEVAHQGKLAAFVQQVQGDFRGMHFGQDGSFDGQGYAVFFVGGCHVVGADFDRVGCVAHGDAQPGGLQHGDVGHAVADGDGFFAGDAQLVQQDAHRVGFVNAAGHGFEEEGLGGEDVERACQAFLPVVLQSAQGLVVVADQHDFARGEVDGGRKFFFFDNLQAVQLGFLPDVWVVRVAGQDSVVVVGEDVESVLPGFLLQIGYQLRIDAAFEDYLSILCLDDLTSVVRDDEASVVTQLQGFGQVEDAIGRSAGGQHDAYARLLHFQQGAEVALADLAFVVEQCPVYVQD